MRLHEKVGKTQFATVIAAALAVTAVIISVSAGFLFYKYHSVRPEELLKQARARTQEQAYYTASLWYELLIQAFPKSDKISYAYLKKAESEQKGGFPELAFSTYEKYKTLFPNQVQEPDMTWILARLAYDAQDWDKAITSFKELQTQHPLFESMSELKRKLSKSYFKKSQFQAQEAKRKELLAISAGLFLSELRRTANEQTLKITLSDLEFIHLWIEYGEIQTAEEALRLIASRIRTPSERLVFLNLKLSLANEWSEELQKEVTSFLKTEDLEDIIEKALRSQLGTFYIYVADFRFKQSQWNSSALYYTKALKVSVSEQDRAWCRDQLLDLAYRTQDVNLKYTIQQQLEKEPLLSPWFEENTDFEVLTKQSKKIKDILSLSI